MRKLNYSNVLALVAIGLLFVATPNSQAQKLPKAYEIQAQAMGEAQQMGQNFNITLHIEEYSTPEEQQGLLAAFNQKGNEGLVNALSKMKSKGRMAITGTLGYEVVYIREWDQPDGSTKLRLVTNRPITFGEAWSDSRSMDYDLSAIEVVLSPDKKKNTGVMYPLAKLKLNKDNHIEVELNQNPWKLVNIMKR
ncbi:MAG TPA: hypothetical protein VLB68_26450 [Pyrinomonadaceae bacterium]|nr:hypothetical protein [Pyrinomonadaceae bacterium]